MQLNRDLIVEIYKMREKMKIEKSTSEKVGDILKQKRISLNLTLQLVLIKLSSKGLDASKSDITRIENGERTIINPILLKELCIIYQLDVYKMFRELNYLDDEAETITSEILEENLKLRAENKALREKIASIEKLIPSLKDVVKAFEKDGANAYVRGAKFYDLGRKK